MGSDNAVDAIDVRIDRRRLSTAIIVLAAGGSIRMGRPKLLLKYGRQTFLRNAAEVAIASICRPIIVVLGGYANQLLHEIDELPIRSVINERWADGMGASIHSGVEVLQANNGADNLEAVVLMVCDQLCVTAAHINDLVAAYHSTGMGIVASEYGGTLGVPALFGAKYFPNLAELNGSAGAKQIIAAHVSDVMRVPFPQGTLDIDTPEDYQQLQRATLP